MLTRLIFIAFLIVGVIIESSIFPFPFTFFLLGLFFLIKEDISYYLISIIFCIFLDILILNHTGFTPLFLSAFFCLILLLKKVFAVESFGILIFTLCIGVEFYLFLAGYPKLIVFQIVFLAVLILCYRFLLKGNKKERMNTI